MFKRRKKSEDMIWGAEAAKILGMGRTTFYMRRINGQIPNIRSIMVTGGAKYNKMDVFREAYPMASKKELMELIMEYNLAKSGKKRKRRRRKEIVSKARISPVTLAEREDTGRENSDMVREIPVGEQTREHETGTTQDAQSRSAEPAPDMCARSLDPLAAMIKQLARKKKDKDTMNFIKEAVKILASERQRLAQQQAERIKAAVNLFVQCIQLLLQQSMQTPGQQPPFQTQAQTQAGTVGPGQQGSAQEPQQQGSQSSTRRRHLLGQYMSLYGAFPMVCGAEPSKDIPGSGENEQGTNEDGNGKESGGE